MLSDIHNLSIRAVIGAILISLVFLIIFAFYNHKKNFGQQAFFIITAITAATTGVLIATSLFVIQNPEIYIRLGL